MKENLNDVFTPEEWAVFETIRMEQEAQLPKEVDGFIRCQQLSAADLSVTINAGIREYHGG